MKKLICILCPRGCHLVVDEKQGCKVSGNGCPRGAQYGKREVTAPVRTLTSTVKITNAPHSRCPVKTDSAIPKELVLKAMRLLNDVQLQAPVRCGDIVIKNIFDTGASVIATRDLEKVS